MLWTLPAFVPAVFATPLGRVLLALLVIAVVIAVGRFVLSLAWKLVVLGVLVVAALVAVEALGLG